jgi:hypothetical protein
VNRRVISVEDGGKPQDQRKKSENPHRRQTDLLSGFDDEKKEEGNSKAEKYDDYEPFRILSVIELSGPWKTD